ncbi:MAG: double zinc ribbon domain-containing protein, partial [Acidobacteriota bacterium]|nr:double zinc ribbon domain-containing protein [Acidobacteriota bacterium]
MPRVSLRAGDPRTEASVDRGGLAEIGASLLSVLMPACCRICESLLTNASRIPICDECIASFQPIPGRVCDKCGKPVEARSPIIGEITERTAGVVDKDGVHRNTAVYVCPVCVRNLCDSTRELAFERVRSWSLYDGTMVKAIILLKYENIEPLGGLFARYLAELVAREGTALSADVVVPVPLHRQRERERGYNQAAVIAKPLAQKLGLPYKSVLLTRVKPRPDKHI